MDNTNSRKCVAAIVVTYNRKELLKENIECLLDVRLMTNNVRYGDIPYAFTENQNLIVNGGNSVVRKLGRS